MVRAWGICEMLVALEIIVPMRLLRPSAAEFCLPCIELPASVCKKVSMIRLEGCASALDYKFINVGTRRTASVATDPSIQYLNGMRMFAYADTHTCTHIHAMRIYSIIYVSMNMCVLVTTSELPEVCITRSGVG